MKQRRPRNPLWWPALGVALLFAAGAHSETTPSPATAGDAAPIDAATPSGSGVSASGVRAFIDPATGKLTANPSPEQLQRMALAPRAAMSRSTLGLRPFALGRGGRGVNLEGRFDTALRVRIGEDGAFHMTCGDPAHGEAPHSHVSSAVALPATAPTPNRPADDDTVKR